MGIMGSLMGVELSEHKADHSPTSTSKVNNKQSFISITPTCLHCEVLSHRDTSAINSEVFTEIHGTFNVFPELPLIIADFSRFHFSVCLIYTFGHEINLRVIPIPSLSI
jgi:hypothetical protein